MKAGVRISPRGVEMMPVRACPSVAETEKLKPDAIVIFLRLRLPCAKFGHLPRAIGKVLP
jgi:hypothetical protein